MVFSFQGRIHAASVLAAIQFAAINWSLFFENRERALSRFNSGSISPQVTHSARHSSSDAVPCSARTN
jgi:hypothetical protein